MVILTDTWTECPWGTSESGQVESILAEAQGRAHKLLWGGPLTFPARTAPSTKIFDKIKPWIAGPYWSRWVGACLPGWGRAHGLGNQASIRSLSDTSLCPGEFICDDPAETLVSDLVFLSDTCFCYAGDCSFDCYFCWLMIRVGLLTLHFWH